MEQYNGQGTAADSVQCCGQTHDLEKLIFEIADTYVIISPYVRPQLIEE